MPARTDSPDALASGVDDVPSLSRFLEERYVPQYLADRSAETRRTYPAAIGNLERFLERPPSVSDLTHETLSALLCSMQEIGYSVSSRDRARVNLLRLARAAFDDGLLPAVPVLPKPTATRRYKPEPWSLADLERILSSARSMPGDVCGIPAGQWWSAFLLLLLDTRCSLPQALSLTTAAYDADQDRIAVGLFVYALHDRTASALADRLAASPVDDRLLPWDLDRGRPPFQMLAYHYQQLLYQAGLPYRGYNLFDRLSVSAKAHGERLDELNPTAEFIPRSGLPDIGRPRQLLQETTRSRVSSRSLQPGVEVVIIRSDSDRTLQRFFEDVYRPRRLHNASKQYIDGYPLAIRRLGDYAACDVTLDQLSDWLLEGFLVWMSDSDRFSPHTINNWYRAPLMTLWGYAYKRKLIDERPGDIPKLTAPKRQPRAWSQEEMARIFQAAAETPGLICGIPAGDWWVSLLMTLYDTGLRISALLSAECRQLDIATSWLSIPAEVQKQNADQTFRLHPETMEAIRRTRPADRERLFPQQWKGDHALRDRFREILIQAGLSHGPKDLFHKIRRTHATYLAAVTDLKHVQASLGHSSSAVTRAYIDPTKVPNIVRATDVLPRPALQQEGVA